MNFRFVSVLFHFVLVFISCQKDSDSNNDQLIDPTGSVNKGRDNVHNNKQIGTPCRNGYAGKNPCNGYDLLAHIDLYSFESTNGNDSWGWTDPDTQKEYVLMGLDDGTAFVDISEPTKPILIGKLPTETEASPWRDIKVHNNHAYIVSEAADHGVQVFDLTRLRNAEAKQNFTADRVLKTVPTAHNIAINPDSGYGYVVGTNRNDEYSGTP